MVRSTLLVSLLAATSTAFAARPSTKAKTRVPGAFIFEFDEEYVSIPLWSSTLANWAVN